MWFSFGGWWECFEVATSQNPFLTALSSMSQSQSISFCVFFKQGPNLGHILFRLCHGGILGVRDDSSAAIPLEQMAGVGRQGKKIPGKEVQHITNLRSKCVNLWSRHSSEETEEILLKPRLTSQTESFSSTSLKHKRKMLPLRKLVAAFSVIKTPGLFYTSRTCCVSWLF